MKSSRRKPRENRTRGTGNRKMREEVYGMQTRTRAHGQWMIHILMKMMKNVRTRHMCSLTPCYFAAGSFVGDGPEDDEESEDDGEEDVDKFDRYTR